MSSQTWKVTATPRERFRLAMLLLHRDLKFKTRKSERELHRARQALGLIAPTEVQLEKGRVGQYATDRTTRHCFAVTAENAEFVLAQVELVEINPAEALWLEPLLQQLESKADAPDADAAPAYDEAEELEHWQPSSKPILDRPEMFAELLGEAISVAADWPDFQRRYAKAMAPEPPEPRANGEHRPAA
jgi:hypothetical protein